MKIFYDTEFIDDGETIEFISIGMVREDGTHMYRVTDNEHTILRAIKHSWLSKNVMPYLPVKWSEGDAGAFAWEWDMEHPDILRVKDKRSIAEDVRRFIYTTPKPELWAWYAAYDHVVMAQLFGSMQDLPDGIPMFTNDLKQEHVRLGSPRLPRQQSGEHNALADAHHNQEIGRYMQRLILDGNA